MQIDYPRWPPGTVFKISINTKMTISQEPLVEIDPTLCQNVFLYEAVLVFCNLAFQDGCHLSLLKIAQNMKHWLGAYRTHALYSGHIFVRFNDLEDVFT